MFGITKHNGITMLIRVIVERPYSLKSATSVIVRGVAFALNVPSDE